MEKNGKIQELHGDNRIVLWENIPLENPLAIFIEPSSSCNLECCYCPHSIGKERFEKEVRPFANMSLEVFEKIVGQIKEFGKPMKMIELSGIGEPIFNPHLPDMIRLLKESACTEHIRMITNAILLTPQMIDKIVDAGVDSVRISLQGLSDSSYEKITRRKADFRAIIENLKYFYENRGKTQLFLKNINIALTEEEKETFIREFSNIADRIYIENIVPYFINVDYDGVVEDERESRYHREVTKVDICPSIFTGLDVNVFGDISVCGQIEKPIKLGNVKTSSLKDAWNSEERQEFLKLQLRGNRYDNFVCNRCKIPMVSLASEEDIIDPHAQQVLKKFEA